MKSNLFQIEAAKAAALRIYKKVNYSGGPLEPYQVSDLLSQVYQYVKIPFKPTSKDVKAYSDILDVNRDGQVTLNDLQALAIQFLNKDNSILQQSFSKSWKTEETSLKTISNIPQESQMAENNISQIAIQYLTKTRQIFWQHATQYNTITTNQVSNLLTQTYEAIGRKGYSPNQEDVRVWMKLCDGNGDGHVQYEQFENFVARSLQRMGIQVFL